MDNIVVSSIGVFHHGMKFLKEVNSYSNGSTAVTPEKMICDEVLDSNILHYLPHEEVRRIDKICKLLLVAGLKCLENLAFEKLKEFKTDLGVVGSTVFGSMASSEHFINSAFVKGVKNASPIIFPFTVPNASTGILTTKLGVNGFNTTLSGYNPIGYSFDLLNLKRAKGLFVSGCDEVTDRISAISLPANLFYNGNYSEGATTLFVTTESFAKENGLPQLFELIGFESTYNLNGDFTFDNSDKIGVDTITRPLKEIFSKYKIKKEDVAIVVSAFSSNSQASKDEQLVVNQLLEGQNVEIIHPKNQIGEAFSNNEFSNIICGYSHLLKVEDGKIAIVNSYSIGGNFSSIIIKR